MVAPSFTKHPYGTDPNQYGELYLPTTQRRPGTVVVIHGGFWRAQYGAKLGQPLAADLAAHGWAAWNLEYRRVGNGGGWPQTLDDVAAGIDALRSVTADLDLDRVVAIGHSAGGHLAAWAAGRAKLPVGSPGALPGASSAESPTGSRSASPAPSRGVALTGVISQAGVLCLTDAANQGVGGTAVPDILGGSPAAVPDRYRDADPVLQIPLSASVLCVHSRSDDNVPFSQSEEYVQRATAAGARATLTEVTGTHFDLIDTTSSAWAAVIAALPALIAG